MTQNNNNEAESETFDVDSILDHKVKGNKKSSDPYKKYLVFIKWKDYDDEDDNTWEPLENIYEDVEDVVTFYFESLGLQIKQNDNDNTLFKLTKIINDSDK